MHFELKDKDGNALISEEKLNLAVPFCGLVETQFNLPYNEYQTLIEKELVYLYDAINEYLGFDLLFKIAKRAAERNFCRRCNYTVKIKFCIHNL